MLPCPSGRSERKLGPCSAGVAGAVVGPVREDQDHGLIQRAAPRVVLAVRVALGAAVVLAFAAQVAEGDRVAAGLGEEVIVMRKAA